MGCNCKSSKKLPQPKQINKTSNRINTSNTINKNSVIKRVIRRRPI